MMAPRAPEETGAEITTEAVRTTDAVAPILHTTGAYLRCKNCRADTFTVEVRYRLLDTGSGIHEAEKTRLYRCISCNLLVG